MEKYLEDFELWARECVRIADKETGLPVPFLLNAPQRRVLALMEDLRRQRRPIRIIMLKARQWGGSTLVQVYMAWMQLVRREGWNSLICAHVKDAATGIRGMYSRLLRQYPAHLKREGKWELLPYEKSSNVCRIEPRGCIVSISSSNAPDSVRGYSFMMAHLSEVAFWGDGDKAAAEKIVRTVSGSVPMLPDTLVVMESTADGTDNYFYDEWQRAVAGESDKTPIFVPWHEIDLYRLPLSESETETLSQEFDSYERALLLQGVEAQRVAWYHCKRREYPTHEAMMAEFPSTPEEAFASSGRGVLSPTEMPVVESGHEATETNFVVFLSGAGEEPHHAARFGYEQGRLICLEQCALPLPVRDAIEVAATMVGSRLPQLALAEPDLPGTHGIGAYTKARDLKISLLPLSRDCCLRLTPERRTEYSDLLRDLLAQGQVVETDPETIAAYRAFNPAKTPSPTMALRLVAAQIAATVAGIPKPEFKDLILFCPFIDLKYYYIPYP